MVASGAGPSGWGEMIRRKRVVPAVTREYLDAATVHGRQLSPGTEVSIVRERGRFRFINATVTAAGETVLNFVGGSSGHEAFRSFYPERVRTVHRLNRLRRNFIEEEG